MNFSAKGNIINVVVWPIQALCWQITQYTTLKPGSLAGQAFHCTVGHCCQLKAPKAMLWVSLASRTYAATRKLAVWQIGGGFGTNWDGELSGQGGGAAVHAILYPISPAQPRPVP